MTDLEPYFSVARSVVIYGGGLATAFGVLSVGSAGDITSGTDHIIAGAKEIVVGIGMIVPVVMASWSAWTHTQVPTLARVAAMPGRDKLVAFEGIPDTAKIASVEALPQVQKVIINPSATDALADIAKDPTRPKVAIGVRAS
jgi:hypothetical protein